MSLCETALEQPLFKKHFPKIMGTLDFFDLELLPNIFAKSILKHRQVLQDQNSENSVNFMQFKIAIEIEAATFGRD